MPWTTQKVTVANASCVTPCCGSTPCTTAGQAQWRADLLAACAAGLTATWHLTAEPYLDAPKCTFADRNAFRRACSPIWVDGEMTQCVVSDDLFGRPRINFSLPQQLQFDNGVFASCFSNTPSISLLSNAEITITACMTRTGVGGFWAFYEFRLGNPQFYPDYVFFIYRDMATIGDIVTLLTVPTLPASPTNPDGSGGFLDDPYGLCFAPSATVAIQ